uniref:uncharacterized protein n=1 Tax=Centroberyx gerrardi TaxID=166262 RepID=UPI003AAF0B63
MDLTRLAVDAGQLINRAVQYTGETLGQAERTEFNGGLEELLARAESTKTWTEQIISQTEVLLQPSPGARLEDRLYERLDWSAPPRPRAHEVLGDHMSQAGLEMGPNTPYGNALLRCGEAQKQIGEAERKFVQSTNIHFLTPLRSFTEGEYRVIQDERRMLLNKRLDLDIAKTRLRKAHEADAEARNLNANPLDDDYVAHVSYMFSFLRVKWLKMWAQEISQAEMELRICQSLFDRQSEISRRLLEGIGTTHTNHMRSLTDFVETQSCYYAQCHQHAQELQKQLASIPVVLCSNNWQSAGSNATNQPSTSNHVANEPVGLNQVTPNPVEIHQLPGFNQAPPTAKPLSGTEKATESSVTTQLPDQANTNNNNNTSSADSQAPSWSSATDGQIKSPTTKHSSGTWPPAAKQAADQIFTSHSDNHSSAIHPTDQLPAASRTASPCLTTNARAVEPLTSSETASQPLTSSETASQPLTSSETASQPLTSSETASQPLTSSETASQLLTFSETASQPPTSSETASQPPTSSETVSQLVTFSETASQPPTFSETASQPPTSSETASQPLTFSETASQPPTSSETASQLLTFSETVSQPPTFSETARQPPTFSETASQPPTSSETARQPLTFSETASQPPTSSETASQPPTSSETASQPLISSETASQPPTSSETASQPPTSSETASQPLTSSETASQSLTSSETASQPPTSSETASQPLTSSETASQLLAFSETASQPPTSSETASQPPTSSKTASQLLTFSETASQPPTSSETASQPPTSSETAIQPLTFSETVDIAHCPPAVPLSLTLKSHIHFSPFPPKAPRCEMGKCFHTQMLLIFCVRAVLPYCGVGPLWGPWMETHTHTHTHINVPLSY